MVTPWHLQGERPFSKNKGMPAVHPHPKGLQGSKKREPDAAVYLALEKGLKEGDSIQVALAPLRIGLNVFYRWKRDYPEFLEYTKKFEAQNKSRKAHYGT